MTAAIVRNMILRRTSRAAGAYCLYKWIADTHGLAKVCIDSTPYPHRNQARHRASFGECLCDERGRHRAAPGRAGHRDRAAVGPRIRLATLGVDGGDVRHYRVGDHG